MKDKEEDEEFWPDVIYEREPQTDAERLEENLKFKRLFTGALEAELESGKRVKLFMTELELEADDVGAAVLFVDGVPVWRGPCRSLEDVRTYRASDTDVLHIVAVNGKIVWTRQ